MGKEREQARKLAKAAPPLSDAELSKINAEYTAYIFRVRKKREIWTSCCGRHAIIPKCERTDAEHEVLEAEHCPEDAGRGNYYSYAQRVKAEGDRRETTPCPYCGAATYVKELGRTGKRDNLAAYMRVVVLRWHRGFLWARVYYTSKKYKSEGLLTARPNWTLDKVYRFRIGEAICASSNYASSFCSITRMAERPKKLPLRIQEPFPCSGAEGGGYTLIGAEEVGKSPLRYCCCEEYFRRGSSYMRFLAVCCIFPRQVEMLMKAGMRDAVADLVYGRRWNTAAFNWDESDPLVSFGLNKAEMKDFLAGEKNLEALGYYKQFRRKGINCTIPEVEQVLHQSPYAKEASVIKRLKDNGIEPCRWITYMVKETKAANVRKKQKPISTQDLAQFWIDYIDAAVVLGYDLANPLMQMPRGIVKKHDVAVKAAAPIIASRRSERLGEKEASRLAQATARYGFAYGQYIIRAPIDAGEIVDEGKALKHCVGGYAERHMDGKLTILFLRLASEPHKPLATIEMSGIKLMQIQGYKNDCNARVRSREAFAEILDPWLDWVAKGSKRDKEGNPVLPRNKQERKKVLAAAV